MKMSVPASVAGAALLLGLAANSSASELPRSDRPSPPVTLDDRPPGSSFTRIFDGRTLAGWTGDPSLWSVEEGAITGRSTPEHPVRKNTFLIWTNGTVADFELHCSFRIVPNNNQGFANSGIQYRSKVLEPATWAVGGYQADMEAGPTYTGILYEERMTRGIMAARGEKVVWDKDCQKKVVGSLGDPAAIQEAIRKNDWNEYVIIARGNHLQHFINGKQTVDVTDECESKAATSGVLALQMHVGAPFTVQFKDLRLRTFPKLQTQDAPARSAIPAPGNVNAPAATTKVVFIAGPPSHGPGDHEHRAGCLLLQSCLQNVPGLVSEVYSNGWPKDPVAAFAQAATIVVYSDGQEGHPLVEPARLNQIDSFMRKGVGLVCLHYAVEPTSETEAKFREWLGGCFEVNWSVNPTWTPEFLPLPEHAVTRGVKLFSLNDEWYFHMRFPEGMKAVTPVLSAVPPSSTMRRYDGPHEGNPAVRAAVQRREPQCVAWAFERPNGGRAFGFTGGHYHKNWGNDDFRKLVLNAILWTAKAEVPAGGVNSTVSAEDLTRNLDRK